MTDYTKTTDFTSKDSLPSGDSGKIIRGAEFGTEFDNIETAVNSKSNINNPSFTGNITVTGTVDGRDISADGTKLDTIETSADVTDTANVTAAGAVMDSELTDITAVKALNQGVATTDSPTFAAVTSTGNVTVGGTVDGRDVAADGTKLDGIEAGATADQTAAQIKTAYESNADTNAFTDADHTKLDGIEASADVTDATNVTAAGALMDSEVTNLAQVKAFDSADYATAAQGTTADNALPKTGGAMTGAITTNSTFDGRDVATDGTKLDGIEALADVTDTANVTAAGALMDSELTSEASVKALNQGVATTDSPTFAGATVNGTVEFDGLSGTGAVTVTDILDQDDMSGNSATALATQQSIKAYVDSQVATSDTLAEVLANGNATGGTNISLASSDITGTGNIDITGTVTADGLTLGSEGDQISIPTSAGFSGVITTGDTISGNAFEFKNGNAIVLISDTNDSGSTGGVDSTLIARGSSATKTALFDVNGDISFYEDTGTTAKLFWDASAESLGIGTSSPTSLLDLSGTYPKITLNDETGVNRAFSVGTNNETFTIRNETGSADVLAITNTNNVGIGTSSPSYKLEVESSSDADLVQVQSTASANNTVLRLGVSGDDAVISGSGGSTGNLAFKTYGAERMRIDSSGKVGIGTSSPSGKIHSVAADAQVAVMAGGDVSDPLYPAFGFDGQVGSNGGRGAGMYLPTDSTLAFSTAGEGRMRIDSSGNVGIGNTVASSMNAGANQLVVGSGSTGQGITLYSSTSTAGSIHFADGTSGNEAYRGQLVYNHSGDYMAILTAATERMRIDSSGNLLVGKTSSGIANSGFEVGQSGQINVTQAGAVVGRFNRKTSDGSILELQKDGATVGGIGVQDNDNLYVSGSVASHAGIKFGTGTVTPMVTGSNADNSVDLGTSSVRWQDLYLSGGAYLGGTGSANHLDDYEEGTWTPVWAASTSTITVFSATYTKVGNLVTLHAYIANISPATSGDEQHITGLPFTCSSGAHYGTGNIVFSGDADVEGIGILVNSNSTFIYSHYIDGTGSASLTRNNWNTIKSSGLPLVFSVTYRTDS